MRINDHTKYINEPLQSFVESPLGEYYASLEALCESAEGQARKVSTLETEQIVSNYVVLCNGIISDVKRFILMRKEKVIPYVHQLSEKVSSSHDCSSCSGNCKLNHELQVLELSGSNAELKKVLNRLQLASLPLYSQTMYPDAYRILRNRMALIEMSLTELLFLENSYLIPKIIEAQKSIRVNG